jgi:hypothetical protein
MQTGQKAGKSSSDMVCPRLSWQMKEPGLATNHSRFALEKRRLERVSLKLLVSSLLASRVLVTSSQRLQPNRLQRSTRPAPHLERLLYPQKNCQRLQSGSAERKSVISTSQTPPSGRQNDRFEEFER